MGKHRTKIQKKYTKRIYLSESIVDSIRSERELRDRDASEIRISRDVSARPDGAIEIL